jgi:hypothetical protein
MASQHLASNIKLLGLFIIAGSIIMGLILSASGVEEVKVRVGREPNTFASNTNPIQSPSTIKFPQTVAYPASPIVSPIAVDAGPSKSKLVSVWMIITVICFIGFLLWMTPIPKSNAKNFQRHRR